MTNRSITPEQTKEISALANTYLTVIAALGMESIERVDENTDTIRGRLGNATLHHQGRGHCAITCLELNEDYTADEVILRLKTAQKRLAGNGAGEASPNGRTPLDNLPESCDVGYLIAHMEFEKKQRRFLPMYFGSDVSDSDAEKISDAYDYLRSQGHGLADSGEDAARTAVDLREHLRKERRLGRGLPIYFGVDVEDRTKETPTLARP